MSLFSPMIVFVLRRVDIDHLWGQISCLTFKMLMFTQRKLKRCFHVFQSLKTNLTH
jgi:hypothetical protein